MMIPKFRAWYTPFKGEKYGQKMKYGSAGSLITHAGMSPDKYILMQSTGLKDKNGVEIYEGDIIKTKNGIIQIVEYVRGSVKADWTETKAGFELRNINSNMYYYFDLVTDEIIGNIYENPELLTMQEAD